MIDKNQAVSIASRSSHHKHRHAALIFNGKDLVCFSNNTAEAHAEDRAIEMAKLLRLDPNKITLISVAIAKNGSFKLAKPCARCERHTRKYGIKKIYYSTLEQNIVRLA